MACLRAPLSIAVLSFACVSARTKLPDGGVRQDGRTAEASDAAAALDASALDGRLQSGDAAAGPPLADAARDASGREFGLPDFTPAMLDAQMPMPDAPMPMPDAHTPMPDAHTPMPDAHVPMPDAALLLDAPPSPDAPPDLPPDAPPCPAPTSCPVGNPCKVGTTVCTAGVVECRESGNVPDDRACGAAPSCGGRTKIVNVCRGGTCSALASTCRGQCNGAGTDCEPCGEANQSCCGSPNPACNGTLICAGGRCQPCGGNGKICCAGDACNGGLTCERGTCVPCGAKNQLCCPGNQCNNPTWMPPPAEPLACQFGNCVPCGGETGAPCCALPVGGECGPQHFCREDDHTCAR
jgi:hypothetical protein